MRETLEIKRGERYGRLRAIREVEPTGSTRKYRTFLFQCDCGARKEIQLRNVRNSSVVSCGCFSRESSAARKTTHGLSKEPIFGSYQAMMVRCYDSKHPTYKRYGKRGISVCKEWRNPDKGLANFVEWNERLPLNKRWRPGLTLDRIDNNGNYDPSNCRWATRRKQQWNREVTKKVNYKGKLTPFPQVYAILARKNEIPEGLSLHTSMARLNRGWTARRALTTPVGGSNKTLQPSP